MSHNSSYRSFPASVRKLRRFFRLENHQSPFFFHGMKCFFWWLAEFVPGWGGIYIRGEIGRRLFKKLGKNPRIHAGNVFFNGRRLEIGDNFYCGTGNYFAGGPIRIGDYVSVANYLIIETTEHNFDNPDIPIQQQGFYRNPVIIEDEVWIGDRVTILSGVTVSRGAVLGAGAVVTKDVPAYAIVVGNPARVVRYRKKSTSSVMET